MRLLGTVSYIFLSILITLFLAIVCLLAWLAEEFGLLNTRLITSTVYLLDVHCLKIRRPFITFFSHSKGIELNSSVEEGITRKKIHKYKKGSKYMLELLFLKISYIWWKREYENIAYFFHVFTLRFMCIITCCAILSNSFGGKGPHLRRRLVLKPSSTVSEVFRGYTQL